MIKGLFHVAKLREINKIEKANFVRLSAENYQMHKQF